MPVENIAFCSFIFFSLCFIIIYHYMKDKPENYKKHLIHNIIYGIFGVMIVVLLIINNEFSHTCLFVLMTFLGGFILYSINATIYELTKEKNNTLIVYTIIFAFLIFIYCYKTHVF